MSSLLQHSWVEPQGLSREQIVPIRTLLSEPDTVSRRLICSILENESDITVQCIDNSRLLSSMRECDSDLVILDAQTTETRRAATWEALGVKAPLATIVTSYDAASPLPLAATPVDLLIKPFSVEQFELALSAARLRIVRARFELAAQEQPGPREVLPAGPRFLQRLAAESDGRITLIKVQDILWLQSIGNHIRLHLADATHLLRQTMKSVQRLLDPHHFLRVHRNMIVNLEHVNEFVLPPNGNMFVKLENGTCLPLRRVNRALLRRVLKNHCLA